ncbi:hypothetical protein MUK42_03971 [Musa troglodytarum]|uniref:Uncharacterized protein n=1 Tax=Musa troglodytarum TaxID=320322 RepID=A0A9E7GGY7_9LILI|nr:hypothetical protein MUK42_03971 [Musa troglodytarum]
MPPSMDGGIFRFGESRRATDNALPYQDASTEEAVAGRRQPPMLAPCRSSLRVLSPFLRLEGIREFLPSHPDPLRYKRLGFGRSPYLHLVSSNQTRKNA